MSDNVQVFSTDPHQPSHVWPAHDPFAHEESTSCPCGPALKRIEWPEFTWWAAVHPALDPSAYDVTTPPAEGDPRA